jgi:hypothetical protein
VDRQEDRIGLLALVAQGRQHHLHQRVVAFGGAQEHRVELARAVELGGRDEFVVEPEGVEEAAQHRVVVVAEAFVGAEGVGHRGQRPLEMLAQHVAVRHVLGHLAHPVEVVRKQTSRVGMSLIVSKARRTMVVRSTSPKVPMWGRPEGP